MSKTLTACHVDHVTLITLITLITLRVLPNVVQSYQRKVMWGLQDKEAPFAVNIT